MAGESLSRQEVDLTRVQLDVYVSKDATAEWWNPERGAVATPEGWAVLPTGQAFVTRTVKAAGILPGLQAAAAVAFPEKVVTADAPDDEESETTAAGSWHRSDVSAEQAVHKVR